MKKENFIDDIKAALAAMEIDRTPMTAKEVVESCKSDVLRRLKDGAKLHQIYLIVKSMTPSEIKMSYATFRKYFLDTRRAEGVIKSRQRKPKKVTSKASHMPSDLAQDRQLDANMTKKHGLATDDEGAAVESVAMRPSDVAPSDGEIKGGSMTTASEDSDAIFARLQEFTNPTTGIAPKD
jgi:hypothetical protein